MDPLEQQMNKGLMRKIKEQKKKLMEEQAGDQPLKDEDEKSINDREIEI